MYNHVIERSRNNSLYNPTVYLAYLYSYYRDPNIQARALNCLQGLQQRTYKSFIAFLPKFKKELVDGGGIE